MVGLKPIRDGGTRAARNCPEAGRRAGDSSARRAEAIERRARNETGSRLWAATPRFGNIRMPMLRNSLRPNGTRKVAPVAAALRRAAKPLSSSSDLDPLLHAIGDARFVLLGEATHGTSEFYTWRAEISKRLIQEKGFSIVAVEGDWPDCYQVNRFVKSMPDSGANARAVLHAFARWPTWMWANRSVRRGRSGLRAGHRSRADVVRGRDGAHPRRAAFGYATFSRGRA